jgi:hypothetical protein
VSLARIESPLTPQAVWCPSEAGILVFQRHVEEDLGMLQDEINSLASRGRNCDQLLLLRRKLLAQRYFWRVRLNAITPD